MKTLVERGMIVALCALVTACAEKPKEPQGGPSGVAAPEVVKETLTVDPMQLLDKAIDAVGGIEKLKAAGSWKSNAKGDYMGMKYESENVYKTGLLRMNIKMPGEDDMHMVMGIDKCWMTNGPVVVECNEDEKKNNKVMMEMDRAMRLWPLKEDQGWKVDGGTEEWNGKTYPKLLVQNDSAGAKGELLFDPNTHLLVKAKYPGFVMGEPGEFVSEMSAHAKHCEVWVPTKISTTFAGRPYVNEQTLKVKCEPVEDTIFDAPPQVEDGTIIERSVGAATVACNVHTGPYDRIGDSIGKLMRAIGKDQLIPMNAPLMIYNKGPAEVKNPADYITDICVSVPLAPPTAPEQKVGYQVRAMEGGKVLSAYGIGEYSKKSPELVKLLMKEIKKRKLETTGPMRQISYFDPLSHPADKLVSEVHIPLKQ